MSDELSHLDEAGNVHMVDVSAKPVTARVARAEASVRLSEATKSKLIAGDLAKGDALAAARIAGIQAAKRTHELIPLCHPLPIDAVTIDIESSADGLVLAATVTVQARTGVEMEAMTAVSIAALTIYDMVKSVERGVQIGPIGLVAKSGGQSGEWTR